MVTENVSADFRTEIQAELYQFDTWMGSHASQSSRELLDGDAALSPPRSAVHLGKQN